MSKYHSRAITSRSLRVKSTSNYLGPKYTMNILLNKADCITNEHVDIKNITRKYNIMQILSNHKAIGFSIILIIASLVQQFNYLLQHVLCPSLIDS